MKRLRSNNEYEFTIPYRRDRDGALHYLEEASPDQALYRAKQNWTAAVERRRHQRFSVEQPVSVHVYNGEHQAYARLRNYSRTGLRLEDAPYLQTGKQVTVRLEKTVSRLSARA